MDLLNESMWADYFLYFAEPICVCVGVVVGGREAPALVTIPEEEAGEKVRTDTERERGWPVWLCKIPAPVLGWEAGEAGRLMYHRPSQDVCI